MLHKVLVVDYRCFFIVGERILPVAPESQSVQAKSEIIIMRDAAASKKTFPRGNLPHNAKIIRRRFLFLRKKTLTSGPYSWARRSQNLPPLPKPSGDKILIPDTKMALEAVVGSKKRPGGNKVGQKRHISSYRSQIISPGVPFPSQRGGNCPITNMDSLNANRGRR